MIPKSVRVTVSCLHIIKYTLRKIVHQKESDFGSAQERETVAPLMFGLMF